MKAEFYKTLFFLLLAVATVPCLAQERGFVTFTYDNNGNRITRMLAMKKVSENGKNVEADNPIVAETIDVFSNMEISVYPNPTKDKILIAVNNGKTQQMPRWRLTSMTGAILQENNAKSNPESIDLSGLPSGIYLLQLNTASEVHIWKIIKN